MRKLTYAIVAALILSCRPSPPDESIFPPDIEVKAGDIVFRSGTGIFSQAVLCVENGTYSHVGIVVDSAGRKMVVHAVPDEPDYPGDPDRVKMETIENFYNTRRGSSGAVMRHCDSEAASIAAQAAMEIYHSNTLFDHAFDDKDTTMLYCSELVERAYLKAGYDIAEGRRHRYNIPAISKNPIIMPSDLYESAQLKLIENFK